MLKNVPTKGHPMPIPNGETTVAGRFHARRAKQSRGIKMSGKSKPETKRNRLRDFRRYGEQAR